MFTHISENFASILLKSCGKLNTAFKQCNLSSVSSKNHYNIVISGGGMVGTTLACSLGKNPKLSEQRILLLEAGKEKQYSIPEKYSNRVVSLNPSTHKLLNDIDSWKHISSARFAVVKRIQVWDAVSDTYVTFGDENATNDISYTVENDLLLDSVSKELRNMKNVDVSYNSRAKSYHLPEYHENTVKISLDNGNEYTCDLLLGCDGYGSQVRKTMGVNYMNWNYDQMGIVATLKLSEEIKNIIAWQRFLPTGPIALLPLTNKMSSLVWSNNTENAKNLMQKSDTDFVDAVNNALYKTYHCYNIIDSATKAFDTLIGIVNCPVDTCRQYPPKIEGIEEGSRALFPLGFGHASSYITKGAILVGDAAHRIHPLAGQGVNLGFGDVVCLNQILGRAITAGSKITDLSYLKEYETDRQRHNVPLMLAVDGLYRLYSNDFTPVVLLRSIGLQATHAFTPLKDKMVNWASV